MIIIVGYVIKFPKVEHLCGGRKVDGTSISR